MTNNTPLEKAIVWCLQHNCIELEPNGKGEFKEDYLLNPDYMEYSARYLKQDPILERQMQLLEAESFDCKKLDDGELMFAYYLYVGYWLVYRVNDLMREHSGVKRLTVCETGAQLHAEMKKRGLKTDFDDPDR